MLQCLPRDGDTATAPSFDGATPQLNLRVLIVGDCFRAGAISMFAAAGCRAAASLKEAELVVYLGGEDVDPQLYGEKPLRGTYFNPERDSREIDVWAESQALEIPSFGICRGMQFLHVMNGGKLYQHVNNHAGSQHFIDDLTTGEKVLVSSMHHQMCIVGNNMFPLAYASTPGHSGDYYREGCDLSSPTHLDLEAAVYPGINAIAVQGHPEVAGTPEFTRWPLQKIEEFLTDSFENYNEPLLTIKEKN